MQTSSTDLRYANIAAGNYSDFFNALHCHFNLHTAESADAHGRWYEGMEDGRRLRRRDAREGSLVPPEVDFEAKAQDVPHVFRCTPVSCHTHMLCACTGGNMSGNGFRDLLSSVRAMSRLHLAHPTASLTAENGGC